MMNPASERAQPCKPKARDIGRSTLLAIGMVICGAWALVLSVPGCQTGSSGGSGGGGGFCVGSATDNVQVYGTISLAGGTTPIDPPLQGGKGALVVFGSLLNNGFIDAVIYESSGETADEWIISGGGGGGGGGGDGIEFDYIPSLSEWGLFVATLLFVTGGIWMIWRRNRVSLV